MVCNGARAWKHVGSSLDIDSFPRVDTSLGTAGAGSLILEFATLSRLTGDEQFEKAAYKAFFALWNRKSDVGLVGNTINTWTGVSGALFHQL
jgi:lantibiotic modifying enzyme